MSSETVKLSHPKLHEIDDLVPLYEKFRKENPEVYKRWFEMVLNLPRSPYAHPSSDSPDLTPIRITQKIAEFFMSQSEWDDEDAISSALADFSMLMLRDVKQHKIARSRSIYRLSRFGLFLLFANAIYLALHVPFWTTFPANYELAILIPIVLAWIWFDRSLRSAQTRLMEQ